MRKERATGLPFTVGRLDSKIEGLPRSLDLWVYIDAGGQADTARVWGGLAIVGEHELRWIEESLAALKSKYPEKLRPSGELKGRDLETDITKKAGLVIGAEDHRIMFWTHRFPEMTNPQIAEMRTEFSEFLAGYNINPELSERVRVEALVREMTAAFDTLVPVNQHKLLSMIGHFQLLVNEIRAAEIGRQLGRVTIVIDRENFPPSSRTAVTMLVKTFAAAALQAAGMDYRITGSAMKETPATGVVTVDVNADSAEHAGLQYVDILIQVPQRLFPAPERR